MELEFEWVVLEYLEVSLAGCTGRLHAFRSADGGC